MKKSKQSKIGSPIIGYLFKYFHNFWVQVLPLSKFYLFWKKVKKVGLFWMEQQFRRFQFQPFMHCNCNFVHFYNRLMNRFHLCIEIQAHRHRENEFNSSFSFAKLYNCMWSGKWVANQQCEKTYPSVIKIDPATEYKSQFRSSSS